jgi:molybdenum cofactor cytidylyltransferase
LVVIILLAAGKSTRMGSQKLLLPFQSKTILEATIDNIINFKADYKMGVIQSNYSQIMGKYNEIRWLINENPDEGISSSIRIGVDSMPMEAQWVIFIQGDMPFISGESINKLYNQVKNSNFTIARYVFEGKRGNPVIFNGKWFEELKRLKGDKGGQQIIMNNKNHVLEIQGDWSNTFDIDTPEDYQKALEIALRVSPSSG